MASSSEKTIGNSAEGSKTIKRDYEGATGLPNSCLGRSFGPSNCRSIDRRRLSNHVEGKVALRNSVFSYSQYSLLVFHRSCPMEGINYQWAGVIYHGTESIQISCWFD